MSKVPADYSNTSAKLKGRFLEIIEEEEWYDKETSNSEIAERIGIDKSVVSNLLNYDIIPSVKSLVKIADYFDVSIEYLINRTDKNEFIKGVGNETFSERISGLKNERKLRIADITNKCSFSRNSIHVWSKRDNIPSLVYLIELANFFDVSIDYLLGRSDDRKY